VVDRERLVGLASFDGNYLNMPQLLSHWQVKIERASTQPNNRPPCAGRPLLQQGCVQSRQPTVDRIMRGNAYHPWLKQLCVRPP
jgi:hypothetical protein